MPLNHGEKFAAKKFMEESYNQLGGKDQSYYKSIALNFDELDSLQKFSEMELAKNITNPEKSHFLTSPVRGSQHMSSSALNGSRVLSESMAFSMQRDESTVDLAKEVSRYIAFRKMEKSREDNYRTMIDSAVSILNESEMASPSTEIQDVKQLIDDHNNKLTLDVIPEEDDSMVKTGKESKDPKDKKKPTKEKETKKNKDSKESKDAKPSKDKKEVKESKDKKESKDSKSKDKKESKDTKDSKSKDKKEPKDLKVNKSSKDLNTTKTTKDTLKKETKPKKK